MTEDRKTRKVTEEEYAQIQRMKQISEEDKQHGRLVSIRQYLTRIRAEQRVIISKKKQIETGILIEKDETFVDGKRPEFCLRSDIEHIDSNIANLKDMILGASEEYLKSGGDEGKLNELKERYPDVI